MTAYLALLHTQSSAIKFSRKLSQAGIENETMPVPRKLSTSCGIAVKFFTDTEVEEVLFEGISNIYEIKSGQYILKYEQSEE